MGNVLHVYNTKRVEILIENKLSLVYPVSCSEHSLMLRILSNDFELIIIEPEGED